MGSTVGIDKVLDVEMIHSLKLHRDAKSLDFVAAFIQKVWTNNVAEPHSDCNGEKWNMFWFARAIGHEATWELAWDRMNDNDKGRNMVDVDRIEKRVKTEEDLKWIADFIERSSKIQEAANEVYVQPKGDANGVTWSL